MRHRHLRRRLYARLSGEARARLVLSQADARGYLTHEDAERLARYMPEGPRRAPYIRTIRQWCEAHGIPTDLHEEDELDEVGKSLIVRFHIIDRHMAWEQPKVEAVESFVEPGGWINFRQHPWEPSGILPVPADPEQAWLDFVEWCRDGPYHRDEPLLRKETYLRIFTENKPAHAWELRPSEPTPETTPTDSP
jgi:hypothetical protein